MRYLNLFIPIALYFTTTRSAFVSHTYNLPTQTSDASNVVTLDILDDAAYDMRYQTDCADCKCFIESPVLNPEKQADMSLTNPVVLSHISEGRLFLLHRTETQDYSISIFDVSPPSTLTEIVKDNGIQEISGFPYLYFSTKDNALVSYINGRMVVVTIDDQGSLQKSIYQYSVPHITYTYPDVAFDSDFLFLAKGDGGLEILYKSQNDPPPIKLSLDDLEVDQGFQVNKFAVDPDHMIIYIYHPDSNYSTIVAVDFSDFREISLAGNYDLGVKQIKQVVVSSRKFHVIHQENETYHYVEYLKNTQDTYAEPKMIKTWEIPQEVNSIQLNDDSVVIDTPDYLYVIQDDLLPFETESSQLLVDIIRKDGSGTYSIFQGTSIYIAKVDDLLLNLYSAPHEDPVLKCGTYKQGDYAGTVSFKVDIYRDSCTDAPTKSDNNTCLDHYTFDADFTGNTFIPFDSDLFTLAPTPLNLSPRSTPTEEVGEPGTGVNLPEIPGTNETGTGGGNNGTSSGPEETPETSTNTTTGGENTGTETPTGPEETPTNNTTGGETTGPVTGPEETPETPTNNTTSGGDGGNTTHPTTPPEDTNEPTESNNTTQTNGTTSGDGGLIKKPDLIDPDAPYFDKINNVYMLGFVGLIVLTCFGCLVKCLYDFVTRSKRRIAEQWRHKELDEEEEGEEGSGTEPNVRKNKSKGTDEESYEQ